MVRGFFGAGPVVAMVVLSATALAGPVSTRTDCLLVTDADIKLEGGATTDSADGFLRMANNGHEITAGRSRVLLFRRFEDDNRGVDSQIWTKITMDLPLYPADLGSATRMAVRRSYYSAGSTGFIDKGYFWTARDPIQYVDLVMKAGELMVTLKATFVAKSPARAQTKEIAIDSTCPVQTVKISDLDPWTGRVGVGWSSFAPNN